MEMAKGSTVLAGALMCCALIVAAAAGVETSQREQRLAAQPTTPAQERSGQESLAEEVVFFEEPNRSKAYEMLASGQMHIYAYGLSDPEIKKKIETSKDLTYTLSYGNTWELTINPSGPALKTWVVSFVSPSSFSKKPSCTPSSAGEWVTLAK